MYIQLKVFTTCVNKSFVVFYQIYVLTLSNFYSFYQEEASDIDVNKEMDKLRKMMQEKKAGTLSNISEDELDQYAGNMPEDKVFNKFNKRIARHPDQILRYDKGGTPLWITGNKEETIAIPKCQYCDGERQFEFQASVV